MFRPGCDRDPRGDGTAVVVVTPPTLAQVILVKGTSLWARAIQHATSSPYSHVGFLIRGRTYEMDFGGYYSRPIGTYAWGYDLYGIYGMTEEKTRTLEQWCLSCRDVPYDVGKIIGQGLELLLHWAGIRSLLDSKRALTCAEFVCEGMRIVGLETQVPQDQATPSSVALDPRIFRI